MEYKIFNLEELRKKECMGQIENKEQDDRLKPNRTDNHINCK